MVHDLLNLGIPSAKAKQLMQRKIDTVEELAGFFPRKYYDFRTVRPIKDCCDGELCVIFGRLHSIDSGDDSRFRALLRDKDGYDISLTWFHSKYLKNVLKEDDMYYVCGKVTLYYGKKYMTAPIAISKNRNEVVRVMPVYPKIKGMSDKYLMDTIEKAIAYLKNCHVPSDKDIFARSIGLVDVFSAYQYLHYPKDIEEYKKGKVRMDYEKMYDFYEDISKRKRFYQPVAGFSVRTRAMADAFINSLPFSLTAGQQNALDEVWAEMTSGKRLEALITGDVGCGKTAVAMIASVFAHENSGQCVVMAPTLVLAKQHFSEFSEKLEPFGIKCGLLTGETKKRERKALLKELQDGDIHILLGTHAVLSEDVVFQNLALTIVDEEHKFGVLQKKAIEKMDANGVHHLSMTATPIPRSLAMTIYGSQLKIIQIDTMPTGRKPVITEVVSNAAEGYESIFTEVEKGHQAYVICPFIHESESERFKDVASVEVVCKEMQRYCKQKGKNIRIEYISGDMKQSDVTEIIERFMQKEFDVLISTTIVEVGVNVPNATAILIMSAERFGLAALHQLRGRVGRSSDQAYCYLSAGKDCEKFDLFCSTTNGFLIAEEDMRLRGPGELTGEQQSGYSEVIELILKKPKLAMRVKEHLFD